MKKKCDFCLERCKKSIFQSKNSKNGQSVPFLYPTRCIGVFQEKMRDEKYKTTEHNMMYNMNLYGCVILSGMILFTGEIWEFLTFASQYPLVISQIGLYGACSAIGQHYIFVTVVTFGPLMCSIITTTRKFFTVLCSVFLFSNPMTPQKWMATALVFFGLGLDVYGKQKKK